MSGITGRYKLVSSDNLLEEMTAAYSPFISKEDIARIAATDNEVILDMRETGKGVVVTAEYSKTSEYNSSYEYTYGEEKVIQGLPGKTIFTLKGDKSNQLHEVWTDGQSSCIHLFTFSTFGCTSVTSTGADGRVATSLWERMAGPADLCGLYVLEEATQPEILFPQLAKAEADRLLSSWLLRVTASPDGLYEMTDYLGNGAEKHTTFRMGQEFAMAEEDFKVDAVHLVTKTGPTSLTYVMKDKRTGKTQIWKVEVSDEALVWKVERSSSGPEAKLVFRRLADVIGSWKRITLTAPDTYLTALGWTAAGAAEKYAEEQPTATFRYVGKGVWESRTDSKVAARDPIFFRDGEEVSGETASSGTVKNLCCITRQGIHGYKKMGSKVVVFRTKVHKEYAINEYWVEGAPLHTRVQEILIRV